MFGKAKLWFKGLSFVGKTVALATSSILTLGVVGAATTPNTPPPTQPTQPPITSEKKDRVETKTETTTEPIAFTSTTIQDNTLASGTTKIKVSGVNGVKTKSWAVTYTNGIETDRKLTSESITTPSIDEVVAHGTYVAPTYTSCPNGTYVNSNGDTVCSPYNSSSVPSGATAQCRDGSYSFSQSRSGTCSHHGGVATWY